MNLLPIGNIVLLILALFAGSQVSNADSMAYVGLIVIALSIAVYQAIKTEGFFPRGLGVSKLVRHWALIFSTVYLFLTVFKFTNFGVPFVEFNLSLLYLIAGAGIVASVIDLSKGK